MQDSSNIVRTMWHGSPLSVFEQLSLLSFARYGHAVELYAYSDLEVPAGITLCDANQILPESTIFAHKDGWFKGSFAGFADRFRYKLLYERGGIWADLDTLCLRSLRDLPNSCVGWGGKSRANNGLMKFPAGSPLCEELYRTAVALGEDLCGPEAGPSLLTRALAEGRHECECLPISAFYPIRLSEAQILFDPEEAAVCVEKTRTSYSVHWWNNIMKEIGIPKEALPPKGSFLHSKAEEVFGTSNLKAWSNGDVRSWLDNYATRRKVERENKELIAKVKELQNRLAKSRVSPLSRTASKKGWRSLFLRRIKGVVTRCRKVFAW